MINSNFYESADFHFNVYFNLSSNTDSCGRRVIQLKSSINGERVVISIGKKVEERYWIKRDERHPFERAKVDSTATPMQQKNCKEINHTIDRIINYCKDYADKVCMSDANQRCLPYNATSFKEYINGRLKGEEDNQDAIKFIKRFIAQKEASKEFADGTISNHKVALKRLMQYCKDKRVKLSWRLFNDDFESYFKGWANSLSKPYSKQTIGTTLSIIKVWLNRAEKKKMVSNSAFHNWKTKHKSNEDDAVFLTCEEIERIAIIDFSSNEIRQKVRHNVNLEKLEQTRDLFIIACNSSIRHSDWGSNLQNAILGDDGVVEMHTQKTNTKIVFPYNDTIKKIVDKYGKFANLPNPRDKSQSVKQIRLICELANIDEEVVIKGERKKKYEVVGTQTARRSFVSNQIAKGADIDAICSATGHTSITIMGRYNKHNKRERAKRLAS